MPFRSGWSFPETRSTGLALRTTTYNQWGQVLGQSTNDIRTPTGQWNTWTNRGTEMDAKVVLVSDDAALYAVVGINARRSSSQMNVAGFTLRSSSSSASVRDFLIAEPSYFWQRTIEAIRRQSDSYERQLRSGLPASGAPAVQRLRLASAFANVVDDDSFSLERLLAMRDELIATDSEIAPTVEQVLAETISHAERQSQLLRLQLLARIGTQESIAALGYLASRSSKLRSDVYSTLRRIAERQGLPSPPDDSAPTVEWKRWVESNGRSSDGR